MKIQNLLVITSLVFSFFSAIPVNINAQVGALDLSFDTDGIATTSFGAGDGYAYSIAIQSDGKIVVAGYSDTGSQDLFAIARYNTNGTLDNSFGIDGIVTTAIAGSSSNRAHGVAIQSDGKIVAVGYYGSASTGNDFAVVRYNTNGSLDLSFDSDGIASTNFDLTSNDRAFSVAIQTDGKIVVSGYNTSSGSNRDFAVVRYNSDGSLDNTFNGSGIVSTQIESGVDEGRSVAIQNDGKIVVAGFCFDNIQRKFSLVRYNTNGSLDNTFNSTGIVRTAIDTTDDAAYAMAIQSDGKIVVTGYSRTSTYDYATVRYNTNGSLDNSFDSDGIVITSIGTTATSSDVPYAIAIQSDGKIVVSGASDYDFGIIRYLGDGSLDNSFDLDGIVKTDTDTLFTDELITSIALQSDGKIVVAGHSKNSSSNYDFTLARYYSTGATGISKTTLQNKVLTAYPNPFSESISLEFSEPLNDVTLELFNSSGQIVRQLIGISGQTVSINRGDLLSGHYFIQLKENNKIIKSVKLIITD